ncbi:MAG: transglycosylase domain-containing protein [Clostridia bacterium]|nr:transglycosylase domain-containing protein [Clostridia bacterium]
MINRGKKGKVKDKLKKNNPNTGNNKKTRNLKKKKIIRTILIVIAILVLIVLGVFAAIFFSDEWSMTEDDLKIQNINSVAYDKDGNLIAELTGDERRVVVTMSEISEYLPKAFVAIEDERFYKHNGVDIKRTTAATASFIFNRGSSSFGGSTITQQLIKNMMNEKENKGLAGITRKVREMSRAYQIERMISKDQILELYLNVIFMGQQTYGVEVASQFYFSKAASELDLAESAFLAGINHSPNAYNPFNKESDNTEKIKKRTKTVLKKMLELGYIDQSQFDEASNQVESGIIFTKGVVNTSNTYSYHTAAAINQVIEQLMKEKDLSYEMAKLNLYGKGIKIYTTQDTKIQTAMEEEFKKGKYIVKSRKTKNEETGEYEHSQAAMVIIDHKTGKVVGTVGGLGTDVNATGLNRATQSIRQIGSTMKPIGVVAPALEEGVITAGTVYDDSPTTFGKYPPKNSTGYMGLAPVRKAIEVSSNIMNVKMMSNLGPENSIKFLKQLGITSLNDTIDANLSLALGSASISPLETAAAYATIANDGTYITPSFYTKVEDRHGNIILEPEIETRQVMSKENAFIMKSILTAPVVGAGGTAKNCAISGMDVAAKTGTTDDNFDRWLCGFTPYYTAASWYGYDQKEKISYSGNPASHIWAAVMRNIHSGLSKAQFEKPENVVSASICMDSGCVATSSCKRVYSEFFVKGTLPSRCEGHEKVTVCLDSNCIANEYCTNIEERIYLQKPDKEKNAAWSTGGERKIWKNNRCMYNSF